MAVSGRVLACLNLLKQYKLKGKTIVDIGSSFGWLEKELLAIEKSIEIIGVEPDSNAVAFSNKNIKNAKFATDMSPINNSNLKQYTKAYLHHLFRTNELLGMRLATLNNLEFYLTLMRNIRNQIEKGTF